jgi:FkbM family methyltransferase
VTIAEFIYTVLLKPKFVKSAVNSVIRMFLPRTVRYGPIQVVLNPKDPVVSGALAFRVYERSEMTFAERSLRKGMTVVDVGANVGLYSALSAHLVGPEGRVIAFEPDPESFYYLEQTIQKNGLKNVKAVRVAASDRQGSSRLFTSTTNRGDSRLYDNELSDGSVEIETVVLDEYLSAAGIKELDFLKIDVQGFEGQVFSGLKKTVLQSPKLVVLSEFWPDGLRRAGTAPEELLEKLEQWGFSIHELLGDGTTQPIVDKPAFVGKWKGRQYTNVVCRKSE